MAPVVRKQAEVTHTAGPSREPDEKLNPWRSKSCNNCRKKKIRCDSIRPTCGSCERLEQECSYAKEDDGRRPASKHYVESLKKDNQRLNERTEELERELLKLQTSVKLFEEFIARLGYDTSALAPPLDERPGPSSSYPSNGGHTHHPDNGDPSGLQKLSFGIQGLKIEENGELMSCSAPSPWLFNHSKAPPPPLRTYSAIRTVGHNQHILCLNGVNNLYHTPCVDWHRYLPHLPHNIPFNRVEHDRVLDRLWKVNTSWCMRVVPDLFLRDMYTVLSVPMGTTPPRTSHYSPFLHNAMLALGLVFSDEPILRDRRLRQCFADKAKSYMDQECNNPTLSARQALCLLSSFHSGNGDYRIGYVYFGMGLRVSESLGLSLDCTEWYRSGQISEDVYRDRLWSFWTSFVQDKCWSLYAGSDASVPVPVPAIPPPPHNSNLDSTPWSWDNSPAQPSHLSLTFLETCKLFVIGTKIMDSVYGLHREHTTRNEGRLIGMQRELDQWLDELPDPLRIHRPDTSKAPPHVIMLNLTYTWMVILLNRPFYRTPACFLESIKRCNSAAERCLTLLRLWQRVYGLRFTPITAVQVSFAAGTTYLLAATQHSGPGRAMPIKKAFDGVQAVLQYLREMGTTWECANLSANLLEELHKNNEANFAPVPPSPPPHRAAVQQSLLWPPPIAQATTAGPSWLTPAASVWSSPMTQTMSMDYPMQSPEVFMESRFSPPFPNDAMMYGGNVPTQLNYNFDLS